MTPLHFDPRLARNVKAETLVPHQQPTQPNFQTATDFYQREMIKHPHLSDFHSLPELLHACLLEGDPDVTSYTPQPFRLRIRGRRYTPDCYVVRRSQPPQVVELKPRGEMADEDRLPLSHYFAQYGWHFVVLSNESIMSRKTVAMNWHEIVINLQISRDLDTAADELRVLEFLEQTGGCYLDDLIDPGDRERTYDQEIALYRLMHRGLVWANLTEQVLDWDMPVALCE